MSGRWKLACVVLAGLAFAMTTGCVPKDQYDKAVAASRRANEELKKCLSARQALREENQALQSDLAARGQEVDAKNKLIASLQTEADLLSEKLKELKVLLDKAASRELPEIGSVRVLLPKKMDAALRALAQQNPGLMEYLPSYGMIKLKADLTFDKGSADVKPAAGPALLKLAEIVNTDVAKPFHIYVAGHTDDIPLVKRTTIDKHGTNWGLSAHRALAVVKVLFESGVEQQRMGAVGFGKHHPVVPNRPGNRGHELNRRVEIWVVPPDRFLTAGGAAQPPEPAPEK